MDANQPESSAMPLCQHWLCLFTPETWETALQNDCNQAGFTASKLKTAGRIRPGDLLYVYLLRRKALCGCLIASGPAHLSPTDSIYLPEGKFPVVLPTAPKLLLPSDNWLPIEDFVSKLVLFRGLRKPALWQHALRNSPRSLRSSDGKLILKCLENLL
jgi:hypothetical protein